MKIFFNENGIKFSTRFRVPFKNYADRSLNC